MTPTKFDEIVKNKGKRNRYQNNLPHLGGIEMSIIVFISLVSLAIILTVLVVGSLCENGDAVNFGIVVFILWIIIHLAFIWCKMAT